MLKVALVFGKNELKISNAPHANDDDSVWIAKVESMTKISQIKELTTDVIAAITMLMSTGSRQRCYM